MADRSEMFRKWLENPTEERVNKLVQMEKSVRLLIHVWNLIGEVDIKALHNLARVSHQIKSEYEDNGE
jgi:hypothetical protein